jgi:hypothetical protein
VFGSDTKGFDRGIGQVDRGLASSKRGFASYAKVAAAGFVAVGAAGVAAAAVLVKSAVAGAVDLEESVNAVNVTYGKNAAGIKKLGKEAANSFGLSKAEFNSLAVQFSAFAGTIAGKGGNVVGVMKDLAGRGADFASVMNLDVNEAMRLFQSGLAGETEPLRKFGIDLSAAAVEAHAYKAGIADAGKELTEQQKVQARYSLLMKQTSKTQGDFKNTSDSLANSQRILGANWKNMSAEVGALLLPALAGLSGWALDTGLPALRQLGDWFMKEGMPVLRQLGDWVMGTVVPALQNLSGEVDGNAATFKQWGADVLSIVRSVVSIVTSLWQRFGAFYVQYAVSTLRNLIQVITGAFTVIRGLFKLVASLLKGDWRGAWEGIKLILRGAWQVIGGIVKQGLNMVRLLIKVGWSVITGIVSGAWDGIKTLVRNGAGAMVDLVRSIPGKLRDLGGKFGEAGSFLMTQFLTGLRKVGSVVADVAGDIWGLVKDMLNSAIGAINEAIPDKIGKGRFSIGLPHNPFPTFARGGFPRAGWGIVGEEGPELVKFRGGERMFSNRDSARMLGQGDELVNAGPQLTQHVQASPTMDTKMLADVAADRLLAALAVVGG